jgi:hypothetical protein
MIFGKTRCLYRARRRGALVQDEDRLRARYDTAVMGKRRSPAWVEPADLLNATGDPLAEQDPILAARVYGLSNAARPNVALRRIRADMFGDSLSSLADMAIWFQEHRGWSALRSAGELNGHGGSLNPAPAFCKLRREAMHIASARFRSPDGSLVQNPLTR